MIYIYLFILIYLCLILDYLPNKKNASNIFIIIIIMSMSFIAGFRKNVGTDFAMYDQFFYIFKDKIVLSNKLEPIFIIFCNISGRLCATSTLMFFIVALYIYSIIIYSCKKSVKYYQLSIFIFICFGFFFSTLNIIRQWMAIATILVYYCNYKDNKLIKKSILLLLSILSHYSCIIIFPILFLCKKIKNELTRITILIVTIIMSLYTKTLVKFSISFICKFKFFEKYTHYLTDINYSNASILWPMIFLFIYIFYLLFYYAKVKKNILDKDYELEYYANILIFAVAFTFLGRNIDIFERLSHYFMIISIIIIPKVLEYVSKKGEKYFLFIMITLMFSLLLINIMKNNGGEFLPYNSVIKIIS